MVKGWGMPFSRLRVTIAIINSHLWLPALAHTILSLSTVSHVRGRGPQVESLSSVVCLLHLAVISNPYIQMALVKLSDP